MRAAGKYPVAVVRRIDRRYRIIEAGQPDPPLAVGDVVEVIPHQEWTARKRIPDRVAGAMRVQRQPHIRHTQADLSRVIREVATAELVPGTADQHHSPALSKEALPPVFVVFLQLDKTLTHNYKLYAAPCYNTKMSTPERNCIGWPE